MLEVTCECGWTTTADRDVLVRAVQEHGRRHHAGAVPQADEIIAVAVPVPAEEEDDAARQTK